MDFVMHLYQYVEVTAGCSPMSHRNKRMGTPSLLYYLKANPTE
jgi:hypothetical protein